MDMLICQGVKLFCWGKVNCFFNHNVWWYSYLSYCYVSYHSNNKSSFFFKVSIIHAKASSTIHKKKQRHIPEKFHPKTPKPTSNIHLPRNQKLGRNATLPEKLTASILGCRVGSDRNDPDRKLVYFAKFMERIQPTL